MDKREYQEKLQEINRLIAAEDYEGAARIADSIDWKRVRNVQTLIMISEVYEVLERYEDSKVLLLRAYRRSPVGRTVLYRLVECCIKLRQFDQAIEYYSEYVQAAPHDNNKYILKYKIYQGRGSSLDEQIDILKEYLDQEYNEKWAYELARLEIQAGRVQEGLATCDDLVLWFHSGKYVIKALELKKKYAPLTPKQQEIYDNRFEEEEEEPEFRPDSYLSEAATLAKAERAAAAQEEIKTELAADISHTAKMEATKAELTRKAEEVQAEVDRKADQARKALAEADLPIGETIAEPEAAVSEAAAEGTEAAGDAASETAAKEPAAEAAEEAAAEVAAEEAAETVVEEAAAIAEPEPEAAVPEAGVEETEASNAAAPEAAAKEPAAHASPAEENASIVHELEAIVAEAAAGEEEAAAEAADAAEETVEDAAETAAEAADAVVEEAETAAEETAEVVTEAAETVTEAAVEAADAVVEEAETAAEETAEVVTEAEETAAETAGAVVEEAETAAEETVEAVTEMKETAAEAAADAEVETKAEADAVVEEAETAAEEVVEPVTETAEAGAETADIAAEAAETVAEEPEKAVSPERMQENMIRSMREIVSGVGPKTEYDGEASILEEAIDQSKEDQEEAVAARGADMTFHVPVSEASQKRQAGRLTIDDILLSMGDQGDYVRQVTGGAVMSASEEAQMTAQHQAEAKASSYDGTNPAGDEMSQAAEDKELSSDGTDRAAQTLDEEEPKIPSFLKEDVREARQTEEIPAGQIAAADDAMRAQGAADLADSDAAAAAVAFMSTQKVPYTKEIAEAKTRRLPVEEIRKLHEVYLSEADAGPESGQKESGMKPFPAEGYSAAEEAAKHAAEAAEAAAEMAEAEAMAGQEIEDDIRIAKGPGTYTEEKPAERAEMPAQTAGSAERDGGAGSAGRIGEQMTIELPKSEPEPEVLTGHPHLKESQMELFRGFTTIGNLSEQIAGAIWQAENRREDRTSRSGNILILGAHGCGKTTIATGIAKAVAEDMGTHSVKMARIYAADLNRKDIAATIAKIAGGVLIVEEAGDLDDAIVDQLTTAMEFRTDGLIMILEDEQRYIHDLLMRHPRFTMKFTAQIYVPEYSVDDLVNFGMIYANSKDYTFSEEAVGACRDKVEAAKKNGEAVSVTNVIELVDRAIKNANTFFRRIGSSKKRYDSADRIILREKDFR